MAALTRRARVRGRGARQRRRARRATPAHLQGGFMTRPPEHIALSSSDIDDIHKLFDTLIAYMGDRWTSANLYATKDASGGVNCGITCTDRANNSFTYSERIIGPRVAVSPPGANLGPG